MENRRIKIWNRSKGHHDFVYQDSNRKTPIPAGGFAFVPIEEVYYVNTSSKSFSKGILEIDPSEKELLEELGYLERNPNTFTDREIEEILSGKLGFIEDKLGDVCELHAFNKIIEVARKMDLPQSKAKFIEELTGMKVYDELVEQQETQEKQVKSKTTKKTK